MDKLKNHFWRLTPRIFDASQSEMNFGRFTARIFDVSQSENEFWSLHSMHFWRFTAWKWILVAWQLEKMFFEVPGDQNSFSSCETSKMHAVKRPIFIFRLRSVKNACYQTTKIHFQSVKRAKCVFWSCQATNFHFQAVKRQKWVLSSDQNSFSICQASKMRFLELLSDQFSFSGCEASKMRAVKRPKIIFRLSNSGLNHRFFECFEVNRCWVLVQTPDRARRARARNCARAAWREKSRAVRVISKEFLYFGGKYHAYACYISRAQRACARVARAEQNLRVSGVCKYYR